MGPSPLYLNYFLDYIGQIFALIPGFHSEKFLRFPRLLLD